MKTVLGVAAGILVSVFLISCTYSEEKTLTIDQGVLVIPDDPGPAVRPISGVWEVYVGEALTQAELDERQTRHFLTVPPREGRYYTPWGERLLRGTITYRARLENVPAGSAFALEVPFVYGTFRAWVNGDPVTAIGCYPISDDPGVSETRVDAGVLVPLIPDSRGEVVLVIGIGRSYYPYGGMTYLAPRLGPLVELQRLRVLRSFRDGLFIGIALLIAVYHLLLVFSPNRDTPNLCIAAFSAALAYRFLAVEGEVLLGALFNLSAPLMMRVRGPAMFLPIPFFLRLLRRLFPLESPRNVFRAVERVSWIWLVASFLIPLKWWMDLLFWYYLVVLTAVAATVRTLLGAVRMQRDGSRLISAGFLFVLVAAAVDALGIFHVLPVREFFGLYATIILLATASLAVSRRVISFRISLSNLKEQAQRDGLTGIYNRRTFDSRLTEEWARHVRAAQPMTVMMVDVDHFKHFNDTRGHQAGDKVLQTIASLLQQHVQRSGDLVARYGGEEFALILPNTNAVGAYQLAGTICQAIRDEEIPHKGTSTGVVTVSIGLSSVIPEHDEHGPVDPDHLVGAADRALYDAKAHGRDTVRSDSAERISDHD